MWDVTARAPLITGLQGFHTARISSLAYSAAGVLVRLRVMFRVRVRVGVRLRLRLRLRVRVGLTLTLILTLNQACSPRRASTRRCSCGTSTSRSPRPS